MKNIKLYSVFFIALSFLMPALFILSCKKQNPNKQIDSTEATINPISPAITANTITTSVFSNTNPSNTVSATNDLNVATVQTYTITGKINSYHCNGYGFGNYIYFGGCASCSSTFVSTSQKAFIQNDGSFTYIYNQMANNTTLAPFVPINNYKGMVLTKQLGSVPANENINMGVFDINPTSTFYVRFKSTTTVTSSIALNSEAYWNQFGQQITPYLFGSFSDTTLKFTHTTKGGNVGQDWQTGYDPDINSSIPDHLISFNCTYNNVLYSAQKTMLKCNASNPKDTLLISLP